MGSGSLQGVLITGSSGQVGGELVRAFAPLAARFGPVHAPLRAGLDLSRPESIREAVRTLRPRWILNAAAYTAVDRAESEPEAAYAINAEAVRILGEEAHAIGSAVLHFSTDYVFSGEGTTPYRETDLTVPSNVYGASKLAGEQALAASGAAHLIVRTSWVYGANLGAANGAGAAGKNFLLTILRLARERSDIKIVADQHGAPTWSRDLARAAVVMVERCEDSADGLGRAEAGRTVAAGSAAKAVRSIEGIYHAAGAGETTWFGFAAEALRMSRAAEPAAHFAELIPVATCEYPTAAARPANSRLDCDKLACTFGVAMMDWRVALAAVMEELNTDAAAKIAL